MNIKYTRSFLKWAGGKYKLLPILLDEFPKENIETYYEPFLGSGVVLQNLPSNFKNCVVGDLNSKLIITHQSVKIDPLRIHEELNDWPNTQAHYNHLRNVFNTYHQNDKYCPFHLASIFIWLNRTGFHGLYRQNRDGKLNTSYGHYKFKYLDILKSLNIVSTKYNRLNPQFICGPYDKILESTQSGDFVYLDPPYLPRNSTANFTAYLTTFGYREHKILRTFVDTLNKKGVKFLLSNSYTPETIELYKEYEIKAIDTKHTINIKTNRNVKEILVKNY